MQCDDVLDALLRDGGLDAEARAHVATCTTCAADLPALMAVTTRLRTAPAPEPSPAVHARVMAAAAPLLVARGQRPAWGAVGRALAVAVPALPLVLATNWWLVHTAYGVLSTVLPEPLGLWLAAQYGLLVAVLVTLGYAAVPLVAAHQHRLEERHG